MRHFKLLRFSNRSNYAVRILMLTAFFLITASFDENGNAGNGGQYVMKIIQKEVTVKGFVMIHKPYCGGASPTPEMAAGTFVPFRQSDFSVVMKDDTSRCAIAEFKTNDKAYFEIKLLPGAYSIFGKDKMQPFNEFIKDKNGDGQYLLSLGTECLKEWYDTPDYSLHVLNDTLVHIEYYASCFTGINPCLMYNGPEPQ